MSAKPYIKYPKDATLARPWKVPALCKAYNWPSNLPGGGVIGILEMGGGWTPSDMQEFFTSQGMPVPAIADISVDGTTTNTPGGSDADFEVALDIQVAATAYFQATGSMPAIRIYWEGNDIAAAVAKAAQDGCDVFSISWGQDEAGWGNTAAQAMEAAAEAATTQAGMIVFAASGDNDSGDGGSTSTNIDLPAGCPHVVGCGGTQKPESGEETVWNNNPGQSNGEGTGGGFSGIFLIPSWQAGNTPSPNPAHPIKRTHRMVPDVSANADPTTGYEIFVQGQRAAVGGTSAVAPLYAGLFAAFGTKKGFILPTIYLNKQDFNDITQGNNGVYSARPGPDACTGVGSPIGTALATTFATH